MGNVIVIGAGPMGLQTALKLCRANIPVTIVEKNSDITRSISCGGLVSVDGVNQAKMDVGEFITNKIFGAHIYSPDNTCLSIHRHKPVAYVIDRRKWQEDLYQQAISAGIRILHSSTFKGRENGYLQILQNGLKIKVAVDILIGADGPLSRVRNSLGIKIPRHAFVHTCQATVQGEFEKRYVQVYLSHLSRNFFAWVIPTGDNQARIGIGTSLGHNPKTALHNLLKEKKIKGQVIKYTYGIIPIGKPVHHPANQSVLLVGDAALQTKSTSGGGLVLGTMASHFAAETIIEYFGKHIPLSSYVEKCHKIEKELVLHNKIASFYRSIKADRLNTIFKKILKTDMIEYLQQNGNMDHPSLFINKFKPSNLRYITLLPELVKFSLW